MGVADKLSRRAFLYRCQMGLALTAGAYSIGIEPHWWECVQLQLPIQNLPGHLVGKTLVQISDLHLGKYVDPHYLKKVLIEVSRWKPDFVAYTGDFITLSPHTKSTFESILPYFPKGSLGTVATLGNHDYGKRWAEPEWAKWIVNQLQQHEIPVLRNQVLDIAGLQFIGMDEFLSGFYNPKLAFGQADLRRANLVLSHNPDTVDSEGWPTEFSGWILSGHTHGGQCRFPGFGPPVVPVKNARYVAGQIPLSNGRNLYINRGIGHSLPIRFNVRPEITRFTLEANIAKS